MCRKKRRRRLRTQPGQSAPKKFMEASMKRRRCAERSAVLSLMASSLLTAMALPCFAQQSLLANAAAERHRYPDGSRLREEYETMNEAINLPPARPTTRAAAAGLAAAARIQP